MTDQIQAGCQQKVETEIMTHLEQVTKAGFETRNNVVTRVNSIVGIVPDAPQLATAKPKDTIHNIFNDIIEMLNTINSAVNRL